MAKRISKEDLIFLPLGGSNEIGMNVNLYHYNGKWIIIDLGCGFAGDEFPGVDMVAPDISFIQQNKKDFVGIVLTHAHEDHLGAVGYLYDQLELPIWATPFTAEIVKNKLEQTGAKGRAKINVVKPGSRFKVGEFDLQMINITHSIPEMNGIMLRTPAGNIFHTGDWKFDPKPVVLPSTDFAALEAIGKEGVLAMVCDSTNVFNPTFAGTEEDLGPEIEKIIRAQKGQVFVTTFASNVARIETICKAAEKCGRRVVLAGLSLNKVTTFAKDTGYLKDLQPFVSDRDIKKFSRDQILVLCTGCQGEERAAMSKIASDQHQFLKVHKGDSIIFSSKIIPGNEKKIFALFNKFVRVKAEVFTEKNFKVHVSGHPSIEELKKMYELVKPEIAVPVHGEPTHIHQHCKLARSFGVQKIVEIQNGEMVKLGPDGHKTLHHVHSGYLGVDGYKLEPVDGKVITLRKKLREAGVVIVSAVVDRKGQLIGSPIVKTPGIVDEEENDGFINYVIEEVADIIVKQKKVIEGDIEKRIKKRVKNIFQVEIGKFPLIEVIVARV